MIQNRYNLLLCLVGFLDLAVPSLAVADNPSFHPGNGGTPILDWLKFEDYLEVQQYKQKHDANYGLQAMKDSRKDGTFWRASKASLFNDGMESVHDILD